MTKSGGNQVTRAVLVCVTVLSVTACGSTEATRSSYQEAADDVPNGTGSSADGSLTYRMLSDSSSGADPNTSDVVVDESEHEAVEIGDLDESVDFSEEVVVVFNFGESPSCQVGELVDVVVDELGESVYPMLTEGEWPAFVDCGSEISTRQITVAIQRGSLPDNALGVSVYPGPEVPDGSTTFVAAGELTKGEAEYPALANDGVIDVGETVIAYETGTHCGVGYVSFGADPTLWKADGFDIDSTGEWGYFPKSWSKVADSDRETVDLQVKRISEDQLEIVAVGTGEVVTYSPSDVDYGCY